MSAFVATLIFILSNIFKPVTRDFSIEAAREIAPRSNSAKHIRSQCPRTATFFLLQSNVDLISRLIAISYPNFQPLTNINDNHLPSNVLLNDL